MRWKTKTFAFVFALIGLLGHTTASRAARRAAILRISPMHGSIARPTEIRTFRT